MSTDVWDVESVSGSYVDITQLRNWSFTVSRTDFPLLSTTYRLYMFVDPAGAFTETDEGDNMIPTQFLLTRSS